jgi:hypothetical protein
LFDYIGLLNDKEDDKDEEKEEQEEDVSAEGDWCLLNNIATMKRFGVEYEFIVNIVMATIRKLTIQEYTIHGRLKKLVAGPFNNKGAERWWAMVVMALAALNAFVHQNVYIMQLQKHSRKKDQIL